jgi:hypothetical protein
MFNKPILRITTQSPPLTQTNETQVCIVKSTALDNKPVIVNVAKVNGIPYTHQNTPNLSSKLTPDQVMTVISKSDSNVRKFTYSFRVFTESYNFLRITRGIANVVFSS